MTKDEEVQITETTEQEKDDGEESKLSKSEEFSHGNVEEALSSSDSTPPNTNVLSDSKSGNSTEQAHQESDVKEISQPSNSSNMPLEKDGITSIENDGRENFTSKGSVISELMDMSAENMTDVLPSVESNGIITDLNTDEPCECAGIPTNDPNSVTEDSADSVVGELPEISEESATISNCNPESKSCSYGGQDGSVDILSSVKDSALGEASDKIPENATNLTYDEENAQDYRGDEDDDHVALINVEDASDVHNGKSSETESDGATLSNSNINTVKSCSHGGQDESNDILSSVKDSADVLLGEQTKMEIENAEILNSDMDNVKVCSTASQDESDDVLSSVEDMDKDIAIELDTAQLDAKALDGLASELENNDKPNEKTIIFENASTEVVAVDLPTHDELQAVSSRLGEQHETDDSKMLLETGFKDHSSKCNKHCESDLETNHDDIKINCAIPPSSEDKDEMTQNEDAAHPSRVVPIKLMDSLSNFEVERIEPAIDNTTDTAAKNDLIVTVTTGNVLKPGGTSVSAVPSLKGTAAKYSCVGSALKVSVPSKCIHNAKSGTIRNAGTPVRTEKFSIKNVSKVSKIFKVSNLSYKIKPVLKPAASLNCPIIYVGEPAFVDIEDFTDGMNDPGNMWTSNFDLSSPKNQMSDTETIDWSKSIPAAYATSMIKPARLLSLSYDTNQGINAKRQNEPAKISSANPSANVPYVQLCSPYAVPSYQSKESNNHEKRVPIASAVPQQNQKQNSTLQQGTSFRIVARPAMRQAMTGSQKLVENTPGIATVKLTQNILPVIPKPAMKSNAVMKNIAKTNVVSIATIKPISNIAVTTCAKTKPKELLSTGSSKAATVKSPMKLVVRGKLPPASAKVVNIFSARVPSTQVTTNILPVKPTLSRPAVSTNVSTVCKNISTVYIKTLSTAKSPPTVVTASNSTKMTAKSAIGEKSKKELTPTITHKGLRAGVEVAFEDGVRHFISSLSQVTHLDDEPIHSWSELKKGTKVAASWTDGQVYDATVVACYFPMSKRMQPVVALKSLPAKVDKKKTELTKTTMKSRPKAVPMSAGKKVGCTRCRKVFISIVDFREHQKLACNSTGVLVPSYTNKVTDEMISVIMKEEKLTSKNYAKSPPTKKPHSASPSPQSNLKAVKRSVSKDIKTPPRKKAKISQSVTKSQLTLDSSNEAIFKKGTKFLHRWQLDGGESKWYQGEVQSVVSSEGSFLNWEFEVSYKGENDSYVLKLYEDFPTDIRIIGKM